MFNFIFDLSYQRDFQEAIVFYFCYFVFAYFVTGIFYTVLGSHHSLSFIILLAPFVFYTLVAINTCIDKELKDYNSIIMVVHTVSLSLVIPLVLSIGFGNFSIFVALLLGGIPSAILSMKEDYKDYRLLKAIEKQQLKQRIKLEKQLLYERVIYKDRINNTVENKKSLSKI